jgi:hypothetical protein
MHLIFGCINKEWNRCHNGEPNIEFGHFFIRITGTGPSTMVGILEAHKALCDQVSFLLSREKEVFQKWPRSRYWPDSLRNYKQLPLCQAIVVTVDKTGP